MISANAQKKWSLTDCIDYALENNIELNQQKLQVKKKDVNLLESKLSILPSLTTGTNAGFNYGRNVNPVDNSITYNQTLNNRYFIESSVNIFQGLVKLNTIGFNRYMQSAMKAGVDIQQNRLIFDILSGYYSVLYCNGLEQVAAQQVEVSNLQVERMKLLVKAGKESQITVQQLESQWASDKLNLTQAENATRQSVLILKQLLRIETNYNLFFSTLSTVNLQTETSLVADSVFQTALQILPQIEQYKMFLKASEKDLAIAKGLVTPRFYLFAGLYSGYYNANDPANPAADFSYQLNNNLSQQVALGVSIPIFKQASGYSRIKQKQISVKEQQLKLEKTKDNLYSEISTAIEELNASKKEYYASQELRNFSKLSLKNVSIKLEHGLSSVTDYESARQKYTSAEAGLLKSKLMYVMRKQILKFYQSGNWNHLYN